MSPPTSQPACEPSPRHHDPAAPDRGRGAMVCLAGIDGAGKKTAVAGAAAVLRERGLVVAAIDKKHIQTQEDHVRRHVQALSDLIWEHPDDDPCQVFGDMHWVHLHAASYDAAYRCLIRPLLEAGALVLTDTWTHRFLAELSLRPAVDVLAVRAAFAEIPAPDLVIQLVLPPLVAAGRKGTVRISATGNRESSDDHSIASFIGYQQKVAAVLERWAHNDRWRTIQVAGMQPPRVAHAVADQVMAWLAARQPSTGAALDGGGET